MLMPTGNIRSNPLSPGELTHLLNLPIMLPELYIRVPVWVASFPSVIVVVPTSKFPPLIVNVPPTTTL